MTDAITIATNSGTGLIDIGNFTLPENNFTQGYIQKFYVIP
jgi:hypothetical protein